MSVTISDPVQMTTVDSGFDAQFVQRLMPHREYMILLDRVLFYDAEERRMIGVHTVAQNDPVVQAHFPGDPRFPGSLLIEALAQSSGFLMNVEYLRRQGLDPALLSEPQYRDTPLNVPMTVLVDSKVRQLSVARPGDRIELHAQMVLQHGGMCHFRVSARVDAREIARGEIMLAYPPYMS